MRWMLLMLCLTAAVAAQGTPRDWVFTVNDLKSKLGADYRPNPRKESLQHGDFVVSGYYVYSYSDSKRGIFLVSQVNRDLSSWDAQMSFVGAKYGLKDSEMVDCSKTVAAGEESRALRSANGKSWMFAFRQRKAWGTLLLMGVPLKEKEMDALVESYVARVNSIQTRKRIKSKPKGIWRWP